ncbi:cytochrome P450 2K1-like [Coregonus clupeaformis]|uniref:cytochrome P450 2K1-like n=1 Tax=Coregonus clupeaformis TaxID=59861 RepID=UPI001E1C25FA|nr:cytochrome P450 2K1-like [Coregonus clupeaformis]
MALMGDLLLQAPSTVTLLGALLFMMVLYLLFSGSSSEEQGKEPPGPRPLPLLGNMLLLDLKKPYHTLCELSKKYGSVFTVHFGPKKVVVLAGYKTVKQALVNQAEEFGNRDIPRMSRDINEGHGILFANGDSWREMRRFALTNLRDFGMGKKGAEEKIIEEIPYLIELFEKHKGKAFDTTQPVNYAASNIISAIVYGSRFEYSDSQFRGMVDRANESIRLSGSASIQLYNMFSWLGPWLKSRKVMLKNVDNNHRDVKELVRGLKESLNPQMYRGFVDSFLVRKQKVEESGNMDSHYHENNLISSVTNLFAAGTDTTGTTLRWGLMLMAKYPHIQDRVQEEISRVIGSRQPLVEDRKNLPYTDAVIHEIQRLANIVPMSIPHATSRDVTFQGYFIKKGTSVIPLLTSVLHDDSEWESPHSFNPSHFLDEQGRFVKRDAFMAFSAGRRVCLGEGLARMELFLFFTSLLQHFSFTPPPGVTEDDLDLTPLLGFTLNPSPHQLCAVSRI